MRCFDFTSFCSTRHKNVVFIKNIYPHWAYTIRPYNLQYIFLRGQLLGLPIHFFMNIMITFFFTHKIKIVPNIIILDTIFLVTFIYYFINCFANVFVIKKLYIPIKIPDQNITIPMLESGIHFIKHKTIAIAQIAAVYM
jgi:hypothetical protein